MTASLIRTRQGSRQGVAQFVVAGVVCVIGGGLLSAATAPVASYHSSWAVAYVVLVAGVAQVVLGLAQGALAPDGIPVRVWQAEFGAWNLGNAAVVAGTVLDVPPLLYAGCVLLVTTLALVLTAIRRARPGRLLTTTRLIVVLLLVSMPVGVALQALDR